MSIALEGAGGSRPVPRAETRNRLAIASRVAAAVVGGYALTAAATACLSLVLPGPTQTAVMAATMLSFAVYTAAVLWVFAARTAWSAWAGIAFSGAAMVVVAALAQALRGAP